MEQTHAGLHHCQPTIIAASYASSLDPMHCRQFLHVVIVSYASPLGLMHCRWALHIIGGSSHHGCSLYIVLLGNFMHRQWAPSPSSPTRCCWAWIAIGLDWFAAAMFELPPPYLNHPHCVRIAPVVFKSPPLCSLVATIRYDIRLAIASTAICIQPQGIMKWDIMANEMKPVSYHSQVIS